MISLRKQMINWGENNLNNDKQFQKLKDNLTFYIIN